MNWHQVIDERSYEMNQVIVDILRHEPDRLLIVNEWIDRMMSNPDYCDGNKAALQEWVDLIRVEGLPGVIRVLEDRGEEQERLRKNAPFAVLMPQDRRMEILKKYEALRPRVSHGSA